MTTSGRSGSSAHTLLRVLHWAVLATPGPLFAHGLGARHELPAPLWLFIGGAALTVTLSFVVVAAYARRGAERYAAAHWDLSGTLLGRLAGQAWPLAFLKFAGIAALALALLAGFFGTSEPNRNIAPTLVWIVWWVGFSYLAMLVGNLWPSVNPWRTLYDLAAAPGLARRAAARAPHPYPASLGCWPALAGLLVFGWIELVFPLRATPHVLAWLLLGYSAITWTGMARYGADVWLRQVDPFHRLFELLSRFAPFTTSAGRGLLLRPHGAGLLDRESAVVATAEVAFILAMLAIVLFDGFQGSKHWLAIEDAVHALNPRLGDGGWLVLHSAGLLVMWLAFLGLYYGACALARRAAGGATATTLELARWFAPTLIPIAIGYHFAHSFVNLLVQAQSLAFLVSDPLGLGWNLFGTRDATVNAAIIGTGSAWYLAFGAIIVGHAFSVYLAHAVAERMLATRAGALRALLPMTALMILYTIISLQILAEPLVRYSGPQEIIIQAPADIGLSLIVLPLPLLDNGS